MQLVFLIIAGASLFASFWVPAIYINPVAIGVAILSLAFCFRRISIPFLLPYILWLQAAVILRADFAIAILFAVQLRIYLADREAESRKQLFQESERLKSLIPKSSLVFVDMDIEAESPVDQIQEGHLIRLNSGDFAPCDGIITFGSGVLEETQVSGDHEPKIKGMGNQVLAGSSLKNGSIIYRASSRAEESFLYSLIQQLRAPTPSNPVHFLFDALPLLSSFYLYFTQKDFLLASIPLLFSFGYFFDLCSKMRAQVFRKEAAKLGISASYPEPFARIDSCIGSPRPLMKESKTSWVSSVGEWSEDAVLKFVGPLARKLEDDCSFAVLHEMQKRRIPLELLDEFEISPSGSIKGKIEDQEIQWLTYSDAKDAQLPIATFQAFLDEQLSAGNNIRFLLADKKLVAAQAIEQKIRPQTIEGKTALDLLGIPFVLVSPQSKEELKELSFFEIKHQTKTTSEVENIIDEMKKKNLCPIWIDSREFEPQVNFISGAFSKRNFPLAKFAHLHLASFAQLIKCSRHFQAKANFFLLEFLIFQGLAVSYFLSKDIRIASLAAALFLLVGYLQSIWIYSPSSPEKKNN
jgi:hypothetical protein